MITSCQASLTVRVDGVLRAIMVIVRSSAFDGFVVVFGDLSDHALGCVGREEAPVRRVSAAAQMLDVLAGWQIPRVALGRVAISVTNLLPAAALRVALRLTGVGVRGAVGAARAGV